MDMIIDIFEENDFIGHIFQENYDQLISLQEEDKEEYAKKIDQLALDICDVNKYVKENELQEVTNPMFFIRKGVPTPDGLLSNEIFASKHKSDTKSTNSFLLIIRNDLLCTFSLIVPLFQTARREL